MRRIDQAQAAFDDVYQRKLWGQGGQGRGLELTIENIYSYVSLIQRFLRDNAIRSVVEFGCGAFPHLKFIEWGDVEYDGFDVVSSVIAEDNAQYAARNIRFHVVTEGTHLPKADLLISKTVFQHLPTEDVQYYLGIFKRLYKFMLITDDVYPEDNVNGGIEHGGYRALRLDLEPFNERCAILQRMEGSNFGTPWVKQTCLLFGDPRPEDGPGIALTNR